MDGYYIWEFGVPNNQWIAICKQKGVHVPSKLLIIEKLINLRVFLNKNKADELIRFLDLHSVSGWTKQSNVQRRSQCFRYFFKDVQEDLYEVYERNASLVFFRSLGRLAILRSGTCSHRCDPCRFCVPTTTIVTTSLAGHIARVGFIFCVIFVHIWVVAFRFFP